MSKILTLGTLNIQNQHILMKNTLPENTDFYKFLKAQQIRANALKLREYYHENDLNFLGTQELVKPLINEIETFDELSVVGEYRQPKWFTGINSTYNETNSIITDLPVKSSSTTWLNESGKPRVTSFGTLTPRIYTQSLLWFDNTAIKEYNNHIHHQKGESQSKQLARLRDAILSRAHLFPTFLTGDFNLTKDDEAMKTFVNEISSVLKRVEVNEKTYKGDDHNGAVDHIFVPVDAEIVDAYTVPTDDSLTDHKGVVAHVRVR